MSDEPIARKALRSAERGTEADPSRLMAAVPELIREARRRRSAAAEASPTLAQLAVSALPRLAAATAVAVIAATWIVSRERGQASISATPTPTTLESVILGGNGDGTGDVVFDAVLDAGRNDG